MAGVDRPADNEVVNGWMKEFFGDLHCHVFIFSDAVAALASGTMGVLDGIVLISGTGTISYGINAKSNKKARASGWGPLLGDQGSGYNIGARVLRAATFAADGRGEQTSLLPAIIEFLRLDDPTQLIPWAYQDMEWSRIASVAPLAEQEARKGDKVAQEIVEKCSRRLAESVRPVWKALQFGDAFTVVLAGGILCHEGSLLGSNVKRLLEEEYPHSHVTFSKTSPSFAAALLAKNQSHLHNLKKHVKVTNVI